MRYVFRVDASVQMGTGHIMRCLIIADELKRQEQSNFILFICRELKGNMIDFIKAKGYQVQVLPPVLNEKTEADESINLDEQWLCTTWEKDAEQTIHILKQFPAVDWIIIDHYGIDMKWQKEVKKYVNKIMVIDDLANRPHSCNIIFDQNYHHDYRSRYDLLVPKDSLKILGLHHTLLRSEFTQLAQKNRSNAKWRKKILVSFGGTDPTNETEKTLKAIIRIKETYPLETDVVVGSGHIHKGKIKRICQKEGFHYFCQVNNMAQLIAEADLAIGAGGISTYERLYMGIPSITISTADNQTKVLKDLGEDEFVSYLGKSEEVSDEDIENAITALLLNNIKLKTYKFDERSNLLWEQLKKL